MQTEFDERIVPDKTSKGIVSIHLKRYDFAKQFCQGKTVLDIACGTGYGTRFLAPFVKQIVGADQSEEAVFYARERYPHKRVAFEVMDACALASAPRAFDVICSFETIEHISLFHDYLKEVSRVIAQDGVYLVSTPCVAETTDNPENPFHFYEWSPQDFKMLLGQYFDSVVLYGQRRREGGLHRFLRKLDPLNLHGKLRAPALTDTLSRATGTAGFNAMELSDQDIVKGGVEGAEYIVGVARQPKERTTR